MLYPVYIFPGDLETAHGVVFPDFPGCFSAADEWEDLPRMMQEAVEVHFEGEEVDIPPPSPLEKLMADPEYIGGVWMLADIDLAHVHNKPRSVRLDIFLPSELVSRIDEYAKARGATRSRFLTEAVQRAIGQSS